MATPQDTQRQEQPVSKPLLLLLVAWLVMLYFRDQGVGTPAPASAPAKPSSVLPTHHAATPLAMDSAQMDSSLGMASTTAKVLVPPSERAPPQAKPQVWDEDDEFSDLRPTVTVTAKQPHEYATANTPPPLYTAPSTLHYKFLERRYPSLIGAIEGGNYPPPPHAQLLSKVAGAVQMGGMALMLLGGTLCRLLGLGEDPEWLKQFRENKMMAFAGVFLINALAQSLSATGAFEVYLDEEVVFSKLETGRMPTANEIVEGLRRLGLDG